MATPVNADIPWHIPVVPLYASELLSILARLQQTWEHHNGLLTGEGDLPGKGKRSIEEEGTAEGEAVQRVPLIPVQSVSA